MAFLPFLVGKNNKKFRFTSFIDLNFKYKLKLKSDLFNIIYKMLIYRVVFNHQRL